MISCCDHELLSPELPMLSAVNLHKTYRKHKIEVPVLCGLDMEVHHGEFLSIVGASGSGKSTLMHLLGTLDKPDEGAIHLEGKRIDNLPNWERELLRNRTFGFIFQFYHLLPELTTLENVLVPGMIAHSIFGWFSKRRAIKQRATELLDRMGLGHRLKHKPRELSGGEMQRAAIARALINGPRVLLADEPTGNLDAANAADIMTLLRDLNRQERLTILMVTHNHDLAAETDRIVKMTAGRIDPQSFECAHSRLEIGIAEHP
jgi:lipoprotein-releasing system ATP-binding protein